MVLDTVITIVNYDHHMFIVQATGYADRSLNYAEKSFMKLASGHITATAVIKLTLAVNYLGPHANQRYN